MDSRTRRYLEEKIKVSNPNPKSGEEYLVLTEKIRTILKTKTGMDSFPKLSIAAYEHKPKKSGNGGKRGPEGPGGSPYSIEDIVTGGCFVKESELQSIKSMLENTKNLILEGPPGTGKTYLSKKTGICTRRPQARFGGEGDPVPPKSLVRGFCEGLAAEWERACFARRAVS